MTLIQYIIAGLVLGGIYAISSAGLVITYRSAGILNFGFGALAYFIARFYYFLNTQCGWPITPSAIVSVVVVGPVLGIALYIGLFRALRLSSQLVKTVVTLSLTVCLPPLASVMFGNKTILAAPGLAPQPVRVYKLAGVPITLDQIIVYACVFVVVVVGALVLRFTDVGLRVRAMVDSPAMTSLSGTSPNAVSVCVWAVSTFLAGLAGVLSAPIIGLNPTDYSLLMAAAFAAVVAAKLRNLPGAVLVGLGIGVATSLVQRYLPPSSSLTAAVIPSIPFAVTCIFLLYNLLRFSGIDERTWVGGALDRAISPQGGAGPVGGRGVRGTRSPAARRRFGWRPAVSILVLVAALPMLLSDFWVGLLATGVAYAIVFLSFTLVTGEGGMIWLCQITFAGVGAITAAQLATRDGWPVLAATLAGGIVAMPMGVIIGILTIRLGNLYVALVTLMFGLLMDNLVFSLNVFAQNGTGVTLNRPSFASAGQGFTYLGLVVFCLIGLVIFNIRRSTTGLALNAVRYSEAGSKIIGISVFQMKVIVAGLAAFVAGIGGAFLGMDNFVALPQNFATLTGVVWLAVLVTSGIRSNVAALIAGLMFSVVPGLFAAYLSPTWGQLPPILFGLGAIGLAMNPDGVIVHHGHQLQSLADWVLRSWSRRHDPQDSAPAEPEPEDATLGPRSADRPNTQLTKVADQP